MAFARSSTAPTGRCGPWDCVASRLRAARRAARTDADELGVGRRSEDFRNGMDGALLEEERGPGALDAERRVHRARAVVRRRVVALGHLEERGLEPSPQDRVPPAAHRAQRQRRETHRPDKELSRWRAFGAALERDGLHAGARAPAHRGAPALPGHVAASRQLTTSSAQETKNETSGRHSVARSVALGPL